MPDAQMSNEEKLWWLDHTRPIIGGTIVRFEMSDAGGEYFPTLIVAVAGKEFAVMASRDEEGNGGGHLFIDEDAQ